jgi:photosystem II stability/assembly factor-like uncharacterized protein
LLESTDSGARWTLIPQPLPGWPVEELSFVSPTTGYEISEGRLFFTRNRGRRWQEIASVPTTYIGEPPQISFSSASDGYLLTHYANQEGGNILFRTEDGGRTWTPEDLYFAAGGATGTVDYAATDHESAFFETTTGGLNPNRSKLTLTISGPSKVRAASLGRTGRKVRLLGHLRPAIGGESVVISYLNKDASWSSENVTVRSGGTFALTVSGVKATTDFVAHWNGNDQYSGAGTPAVQFKVNRR